MDRDAVIEMARKAISEEPYAEVALPFHSTIWMMDIVQLERFAALIAGHETCEFAALKKEVKELREENMLMREIMMASYAPRPWVR
jgi:hypothetical protein